MIQESLGLEIHDHNPSSDDYYTPSWIFDALGLEFETDPCSPPGGIPWIPVGNYYSIIDDGLQQNWTGTVWLNPPFSNPAPWIEKFIEHQNGVALVQISKSRWCNNLFEEADAFLMLPSNLKFVSVSGQLLPIFMPCGLFAMGKKSVIALQQSKIARTR